MPLNKQTGNMYPFVTHTWNPIRGRCPHQCVYCYMKGMPVGELRFEEKELKTQLGEGRFIFVGSSTDMFANGVPYEWTQKVLYYCRSFDNAYLFQSKNPGRFAEHTFPTISILGTTLESDVNYQFSKAPSPIIRQSWMRSFLVKTMISIEPIMDFDLEILSTWIKAIKPEFVSIGADSKGHNLPEPSPEKVRMLIDGLKEFTEVKIKPNLARLLKDI